MVRGWPLNDFRFALQVLDPEMLPIDLSETDNRSTNNTIIMGVELDPEFLRPVAYHINGISPRNLLSGYQTERRNRFEADQIIHRFSPEFQIQTRGFPLTCSAMLRLNMLDGYEDAELVASMYAASKVGAAILPPEGGELGIENTTVNPDTKDCLLYTSPSPRDRQKSRMPSSA